jgi:hypothetical protein
MSVDKLLPSCSRLAFYLASADGFALPSSQYTSAHLVESRTRKAACKNLFLTELINSTDTKVLAHKFYS